MASMQQEPESTPGVVPVHHRIADSIRAEIVSGRLGPNDAVPSAGELAAKWNCSVGSARAALDVLTNEGRIVGGRGRRKRVRPPVRRIRLTVDFTQQQKNLVLRPEEERAAVGTAELTAGVPIDRTHFTARYSVVPITPELAEEFSVPDDVEVLRRVYETLEIDTGLRIAWSTSYIPVSLISGNPDLLREDLEPWPGGHQHQLYTVGIEIERFVRSVTATEPTPADRARWGIDPGVPLMWVRSRSVDTDGRVVELSDATYPADRVDLVFTESLDRWPAGHQSYAKGS
ncbi:transcriptional regulator [Actinoplanes lobatus]|uniref:Transcriptional regulator n=2 Tax=Actinoplanes lobatus TaxID=113568 RepID=A0ABQ4AE35_9ACTN|nr:transcriptional regulator [Actinoplanes lobatus]GIE39272.1 transcriptional regulator [Actinoplanes lobatus]